MRFDAISWYVTGMPARPRSKWSRAPSDVLLRIQRRYRKRFKQRHGWREYVAAIIGVSPHTVGAWKVGTMRPTKERAARLRKLCRDLGRARTNREPSEQQQPGATQMNRETVVSHALPALEARSMASFAGGRREGAPDRPNSSQEHSPGFHSKSK